MARPAAEHAPIVHDEVPVVGGATASAGPSNAARAVKWVRLHEILPEPHVAESGFSADDIAQGAIGDCFFLSACAALCTQRSDLLRSVLVTTSVSATHTYRVRFWNCHEWVYVDVTDRFPVHTDRYYQKSDHTVYAGSVEARGGHARGVYYVPMYARPRNHGKAWMMILEKAYAAYHGGFPQIESGWPSMALLDLVPDATGFTFEMDELGSAKTAWETLGEWLHEGRILGAVRTNPDNPAEARGVVRNHAYSILRCAVSPVSDQVHLIQLRNPWGKGEWQGPWSDSDRLHWTPEVLQALHYEIRDDGTFWMAFKDFMRVFQCIDVCHIVPVHDASAATVATVPDASADRGRRPPPAGPGASAALPPQPQPQPLVRWHKYTIEGRCAGPTSGGCAPNNSTAGGNPHYYLHPSKDCKVIISMVRTSGGRNNNFNMGFSIYRAAGLRWSRGVECVASSEYVNRRNVALERALAAEELPYSLMISAFKPRIDFDFALTVYSTEPLLEVDDGNRLRLIPPYAVPRPEPPLDWSVRRYTATGTWQGESAGGRNTASRVNNPQFLIHPSSPCRIRIQLLQWPLEDAPEDTAAATIGFALVAKEGKRVDVIYEGDAVFETEYTDDIAVSHTAEIEPAPDHTAYTLMPCTLEPGIERHFALYVDVSEPLRGTFREFLLHPSDDREDSVRDLFQKFEKSFERLRIASSDGQPQQQQPQQQHQ